MQFPPLFYFYFIFYREESKLNKAASETVKKPATVKRGCDPSNEMTSNTAGRKEHMLDEVMMQMHYLAPNDSKSHVYLQNRFGTHFLLADLTQPAGMSALPE